MAVSNLRLAVVAPLAQVLVVRCVVRTRATPRHEVVQLRLGSSQLVAADRARSILSIPHLCFDALGDSGALLEYQVLEDLLAEDRGRLVLVRLHVQHLAKICVKARAVLVRAVSFPGCDKGKTKNPRSSTGVWP